MRAKPVHRLAHGFCERRLWQAKLTHRFLRRKVHGASRHAHANQPAGLDMMAGEQVLGRYPPERPQRGRGRGQAQPGDSPGRVGRAYRVQPRRPPPLVRPGSL